MVAKKRIGESSREKRNRRKVKPLILIISEGKDTEINYFKSFNKNYVNVDVKPVEKNSVGKNKSKKTDPVNLVEKAKEYITTKYDICEDDGDRVWCLMDIDINYHNPNPLKAREIEIQKALTISNEFKNKNDVYINLGLSNPCFELWYLLHFKYTSANMKSYSNVKTRLEKETCIDEYAKNKCVNDILHNETKKAIANAIKLRAHHVKLGRRIDDLSIDTVKDFVESNPSTNVDELVKYIESIN